MGERGTVERVADPVTVSSIVDAVREIGLSESDTVLVHSSLSALGWVSGGAQAVVEALRTAVTPSGTVVMPAFTAQYSNPATWSNPPVPDDWESTIRETRPAFRPVVTPSRGVGAVPECFRGYPDTVRSHHPEFSFAAWGVAAEEITAGHSFDNGLGEHSPLARLYDRDADVLFLGTDHSTNTSLHLAEYRADISTERTSNVAPVIKDGERHRIEYENIETNTADFSELGTAFERQIDCATGAVGAAESKLLNQREMVDFAVDWFETNR
ncbi:aminoglycoside N(3)-acetyltransferase [Halocatena pleomorpha]|uniref:Aminoglycoside N(3)-acetyltransferase n=1 Tax=Halocatena pleomorpha TaxID=1785090 RepID=A0A3P3RL11_9EURY|nr:AAC(3) family N-acetyltransferase [Halocatena pleomorpha]RRJ33550.1 aminoglycoside N(3)-acetyltransferase [Halocatena pleomorpha]